ncbi:MAG: SOS response-associated peptidase [Gemmatimonadaceae bacterium]
MALTRPELIDWGQYLVADPPELEARYNIAPGTDVAVVRARGGRYVADAIRWGLIPYWAKDPAIGNRMANARSDTAFDKPAFRRPVLSRRCLIPVDVFYEWQSVPGETGRGRRIGREPWAVRLRGGLPFTLGGVWDYWRPDADGGALQADSDGVVSFAVLTTEPNTMLAAIHDRMPVIIAADQWRAWLAPDTPVPKVQDLMQSYPSDEMEAWRISRRVNDANYDHPSVLEPA